MRNFLMKAAFASLFLSFVFSSCTKDDDQLKGDPGSQQAEGFGKLDDCYGITTVCKVEDWMNMYIDTMPADPSSYYADYKYNCVVLGLQKDSVSNNGQIGYPTCLYFMRFHKKLAQDEVEAYKSDFRKTFYTNLIEAYYTSVSEFRDTTLNGYKASYFEAERGAMVSPAIEEVYLMYHNGTLYGVTLKVPDDHIADSYAICREVIGKVKLK